MFKRVKFNLLRVVLSVLFFISSTGIYAQEQSSASDKQWYICEIKSSKKANENKYFGPYNSKEETLANWIYRNLAENKKYCVAMNLTYMTATPSSYFGREWKAVKEEYDFDRNSFIEKYNIGLDEKVENAYLKSQGKKPEKTKNNKQEKTVEAQPEQKVQNVQKNVSATEETLVSNADEKAARKAVKENAKLEKQKSKENAAAAKEQAKLVQQNNKELKTNSVVNENKDALLRAKELRTKNKEDAKKAKELSKNAKNSNSLDEAIEEFYKKEKRDVIKEQILKDARIEPKEEPVISEVVPAVEEVSVPAENADTPVEYENAEVKEQAQILIDDNAAGKNEEPVEIETPLETPVEVPAEKEEETAVVPAPVEEIKEPEITNSVEEVVESVPEVKEEPKVEPVPFKFTSTQSANVNRYKKEYLQDYIPQEKYDTQIEKTLKQRIENPDEVDSKGQTLLMKAAKSGNDWQIKTLLESGANVNLKDNDGWTALMYACRYQESISTLKTLIEAGAKIKEKNNYDSSALILAATYNDNPDILSYLLKYYSNSEKEVLKCFILLLSSKQSSEYLQLAKVNLFMEKSIPLNTFYQGKTPLMYAAQYGNSTKTLKLLIDNDALTTIRSSEGKTAFDYAAKNSNLLHDENYWALNKK